MLRSLSFNLLLVSSPFLGEIENLKTSSLIQVLAAGHLTYMLDGVPRDFQNRGGIMLVAPPQNLKTVMASCLRHYTNAMVLGDITTSQLAKIRDEIATGRYQSLVFPEFEKLYKREESTASNVEGHIQQLIEEGFGHAAFEDKSSFVRRAHCFVVAALVESKCRKLWPEWVASGFARRWLWCHFILEDPAIITRAIRDWTPLRLSNEDLPGIPVDRIPFNVTRRESEILMRMVSRSGADGAQATPYILIQKILAVLKWRYRDLGPQRAASRAMEVMKDFSECLRTENGGARLEVSEQEQVTR